MSSFFFYRSKLGLFQSRISLQKASVKVSHTLLRITRQPLNLSKGNPEGFLKPFTKAEVPEALACDLIHCCICVGLTFISVKS